MAAESARLACDQCRCDGGDCYSRGSMVGIDRHVVAEPVRRPGMGPQPRQPDRRSDQWSVADFAGSMVQNAPERCFRRR